MLASILVLNWLFWSYRFRMIRFFSFLIKTFIFQIHLRFETYCIYEHINETPIVFIIDFAATKAKLKFKMSVGSVSVLVIILSF